MMPGLLPPEEGHSSNYADNGMSSVYDHIFNIVAQVGHKNDFCCIIAKLLFLLYLFHATFLRNNDHRYEV